MKFFKKSEDSYQELIIEELRQKISAGRHAEPCPEDR